MKTNSTRPPLKITADGEGIATHAGTRLLAEMADASGLTAALSAAMALVVRRRRKHDPGRLLVDVALTLADGGDCLSDVAVLRDQPDLFGVVASDATAYRVIDSIDAGQLDAVRQARAAARARVWSAGLAPAKVTLDFDATLLTAHSDKQQAAATYKRGFGFHPLLVYLDETGEALAGVLRAGNAGANTAADHVALLDMALAQLPVKPKGQDPEGGVAMLARADSAGATHGFVEALRERGIEFSVGFDVTGPVRAAILDLPDSAWTEAITQDCDIREGAEVAELTGYLDLTSWPAGTRAIVRREIPHPGAQFTLFDPDGWRHQVCIVDSANPDVAYLEARHRGHARVEDGIRCDKDTGLRNLPFSDFANNEVWLELVLIAHDLLAHTQRLTLEGDLAAAEPKRLRYTLLHTAGRLTRSARQTTLRLPSNWRWATQLATAFTRLRALPLRV